MKLKRNPRAEKDESRNVLQAEQLQDVGAGFFLVYQRFKKPIASQNYKRSKSREVGFRFYVWNYHVFEADGLLAAVLRILQVNEPGFADGNVQRVNAFEIVAGLFFRFTTALLPPPEFFAGNLRPNAKIFVWPD